MPSNSQIIKISCDDKAFSITFADREKKVSWEKIDKIIAYKLNLMTFDEIWLEIHYEEFVLKISEESLGWDEFVEKSKHIFPTIPSTWDADIVQPPFATNYTILYDREIN